MVELSPDTCSSMAVFSRSGLLSLQAFLLVNGFNLSKELSKGPSLCTFNASCALINSMKEECGDGDSCPPLPTVKCLNVVLQTPPFVGLSWELANFDQIRFDQVFKLFWRICFYLICEISLIGWRTALLPSPVPNITGWPLTGWSVFWLANWVLQQSGAVQFHCSKSHVAARYVEAHRSKSYYSLSTLAKLYANMIHRRFCFVTWFFFPHSLLLSIYELGVEYLAVRFVLFFVCFVCLFFFNEDMFKKNKM